MNIYFILSSGQRFLCLTKISVVTADKRNQQLKSFTKSFDLIGQTQTIKIQ